MIEAVVGFINLPARLCDIVLLERGKDAFGRSLGVRVETQRGLAGSPRARWESWWNRKKDSISSGMPVALAKAVGRDGDARSSPYLSHTLQLGLVLQDSTAYGAASYVTLNRGPHSCQPPAASPDACFSRRFFK